MWIPFGPFGSPPNPRDAVLLGFDGFEIMSGGFFLFCLDMLCFLCGGCVLRLGSLVPEDDVWLSIMKYPNSICVCARYEHPVWQVRSSSAYQCSELLQTECDGTCPEGYDNLSTNVSLMFSGTSCGGLGGAASVLIGCGKILSATVTNGGSGYAQLGRVEPTIEAVPGMDYDDGSGANLSVSLVQEQDSCGRDYWRVGAVDVLDGGLGYTAGDGVFFRRGLLDTREATAVATISVDNDGSITAVAVLNGGRYYRSDASQPPYVFPVSVSVSKPSGESGSGATFEATVNADTGSPAFGRVSAVAVTNDGGSGYVSRCSGVRIVESCEECSGLTSPESSECIPPGDCGTPATDCGKSSLNVPGVCNTVLEGVVVSKPSAFSGVGVTVTITGSFDDSIAINGVVVGDCREAGVVVHSFALGEAEDSFTLAAVDNYGFCSHGSLTICFEVSPSP